MRILAMIIFAGCMAIVALNLQSGARTDTHSSTASLQWQN
jgi:hypothetical protein